MSHAIAIENLSKRYKDGKLALNNVNLQVEEGEFFGLLGANGAGKTTLLGILTSLVLKDSGKVSILGHDIDTESRQSKHHIGVVPQEINFIALNLLWK